MRTNLYCVLNNGNEFYLFVWAASTEDALCLAYPAFEPHGRMEAVEITNRGEELIVANDGNSMFWCAIASENMQIPTALIERFFCDRYANKGLWIPKQNS